jgi:hypothetical protein
MIANGIDFLFDSHTTFSDRAISGDEQFNLELVVSQIGGDSHFARMALTIHYNVPAVPMDHSSIHHSYQPLRFTTLLPGTRSEISYYNTPL